MKSDINVTPFIDVLLVLLIIFMILAPTPPRAIDASVPGRPEARDGKKKDALVVEVRQDGYALNQAPVWTATDLEERLRAVLEDGGSRTLFVQAEADVAYHRVMDALDAARGAGALRIGMLEPKPAARKDGDLLGRQ